MKRAWLFIRSIWITIQRSTKAFQPPEGGDFGPWRTDSRAITNAKLNTQTTYHASRFTFYRFVRCVSSFVGAIHPTGDSNTKARTLITVQISISTKTTVMAMKGRRSVVAEVSRGTSPSTTAAGEVKGGGTG